MRKKFGLISLGCPKNLVDSETFLYIADKHGYQQSEDFEHLDFILVNSCSFIRDALEELSGVLEEVCFHKATGQIRRVFVTGCIMKRFLKEFKRRFPDVDEWINIKDYKALESLLSGQRLPSYHRLQLTDGPYAYLKISDGCDNRCSYCTVPSIRGKLTSVAMENLVREATYLANTGARELIVIAQDTTAYGRDLHPKPALPDLLKRLHDIPGFYWLRLMYLYPGHVTSELVKTISELPKIVHAFEMPLQHCNDRILRDMNRKYNKAEIIKTYNLFREYMPDSVFRTTFITGFPGETSREFKELVEFVQEYPFLRLGAFAFSREYGTPAFEYDGQVSERLSQKRKNELLALHRQLTEQYLSAFVGKELDVLIEEDYPEENDYYGRAWFDAPEIDGIVHFSGSGIAYGDIVKVRIDDVIDIDFYGELSKIVHRYDFREVEE